MVAFGVVFSTLGAVLPQVIARFGIAKRDAGAILALLSFSVLAGSLVFGPVVDRRGYKSLLVVSFAVIAAGLEAIAFAPSLPWLVAGVVSIGFFGALVNGAANAMVVDVASHERTSDLAFMAAFFGIGAAGVPAALAFLAGRASHAVILSAIGALVFVPLAFSAVTRLPPPKQSGGFPLADARGLLREPVLLLIGLMLFLESGMEATVGGWTATFFVEELGVAIDRAPIYLALFWLGLMSGRFALGPLARRSPPMTIVAGGVCIALVSALWLVASGSPSSAGTAVFFIGGGFAPVFPVLFGVIGDRYSRLSGTALSIALGMALTGGMLMPYATGLIASASTLRASFAIVPAALVALALLLTVLWQRVTQPERAT